MLDSDRKDNFIKSADYNYIFNLCFTKLSLYIF